MSLVDAYYIAGIVAAVIATISLFRAKSRKVQQNRQVGSVSGNHNSISQVIRGGREGNQVADVAGDNNLVKQEVSGRRSSGNDD